MRLYVCWMMPISSGLSGAQLVQNLIILPLNLISSISSNKMSINRWGLSYPPTPRNNLNISMYWPILLREQNERVSWEEHAANIMAILLSIGEHHLESI